MPSSKEKQRERSRQRYWSMTDEERKIVNRERSAKYRRSPISKAKHNNSYRNKNPNRAHATLHTAQVKRNYPNAFNNDSVTKDQLYDWLEANKGCQCPYCGEPADSIDHIVPLSRGGLHEFSNLEMVCLTCNLAKRNRTKLEFVEWIKKAHEYSIKAATELS